MSYWFLYNLATGAFYGSPYLGTANKWTNIPDGCGVIGPIAETNATASDAFVNPKNYIVQNGALVNQPYVPTLEEVKQSKYGELKQKETDALATFQSSALGPMHTYLSAQDDMVLLNGEFSFVNTPLYDGSLISWYTVENGQVDHTKDQFSQVFVDGRNHIATTKYHRADLETQVQACTTVDQVNAIVW